MRTIKWVCYAPISLEHRPRMLHKTDILPRQGNLWSFLFHLTFLHFHHDRVMRLPLAGKFINLRGGRG